MKTADILTSFIGTKKERSVSDTLEVDFSLPSSGSGVIGVIRTIKFGNLDDQPSVKDFLNALTNKYGAFTLKREHEDRLTYCWSYKDRTPVSSDSCLRIQTELIRDDDDYNNRMIGEGITSTVFTKLVFSDYERSQIKAAYIGIVDLNRYSSDVSHIKDVLGKQLSDAHHKEETMAPGTVPNM